MEPSQDGLAAHSLASATAQQTLQGKLDALRIDWSEVERLSSLEANDLWVGSLWTGAYRPRALKRSPLSLITTELLVIALAGMVSLPLGLMLVRSPADPEAARAAIPFAITVATGMGLLLLMRYRCMAQNRKRWRSLLGILDEVDRYHETLQALELLAQLQEIHPLGEAANLPAASSNADPAMFEALGLTRDSLITGLLADRILRQQQNRQCGRSRYVDLLAHLDQNLATLNAFDASQQVTEEAQLLQDALQISVAVRQNIMS